MDTRSSFHQSVDNLQSNILLMGRMVEKQIAQAVDALASLDEKKARETINLDDEVDEMMTQIEEECLRLIALQQPMASDLRIIGMAFKISSDLERMADHAVDIAKIAVRLSGEKLFKPLVDIPRMAEMTIDMVRECLLAYTERDVHRASALAEKDDAVDKLYSTLMTEITGIMGADTSLNRQLQQLLFVAHFLERVADHTTNIGEGVIYMVTGKRKDLNV